MRGEDPDRPHVYKSAIAPLTHRKKMYLTVHTSVQPVYE
jgi:hypothetical protein